MKISIDKNYLQLIDRYCVRKMTSVTSVNIFIDYLEHNYNINILNRRNVSGYV
jgi:hypothetical protein